MKSYIEWETFAKYNLGYDDQEAAEYAKLRCVNDQNREIIEHLSFVSGYEPVLNDGWEE